MPLHRTTVSILRRRVHVRSGGFRQALFKTGGQEHTQARYKEWERLQRLRRDVWSLEGILHEKFR